MALIQIENYYMHELSLQNGLPQTTKPDTNNHGYGLKSIVSIVELYGGTAEVKAEDGIFLLSLIIPIPLDQRTVVQYNN